MPTPSSLVGVLFCFPFCVPNVHGRVGNKTKQNIQIPRATVAPTQIHSQWLRGVALGMNVPVSIQPLLLMEQLASCPLNVVPSGAIKLDWAGSDWSGRKHVFISFSFC